MKYFQQTQLDKNHLPVRDTARKRSPNVIWTSRRPSGWRATIITAVTLLFSGIGFCEFSGFLFEQPLTSVSTAAQLRVATPVDNVQSKIDPNLERLMQESDDNERLQTLVYLDAQIDVNQMSNQLQALRTTLRRQHELIVTALRDMAQNTQGNLLNYLTGRQANGAIGDFRPFWIGNIVAVEATRAEILAIAARADVGHVYLDYPIEHIGHLPAQADNKFNQGAAAGGVEPGVAAIRAPEVWAMGIDGTGVLVANIDTGVDGNHVALANRWVGVADPRYANNPEWGFLDPVNGVTFPFDSGSHGTHTMGSVTGGPPGDSIGVAPGAYWMASAAIDRGGIQMTVEDAIESFQWMADPDGNPGTNFDVPAVCSNSWGLADVHGYPDCDQIFWVWLDASEAAGTVQLFSAGNEGTGGLRRPADRATNAYDSCAVAAVDANNSNWPIASFSSRGPTFCTPNGQVAIKPDIAAPGVNVRSSVPGNSYSSFSGTSMASPHVNGVVALMRQANPNLAVDEIKQIIYDTAFDLGAAGEDNNYGWGMIDAFEAVQVAISRSTLSIEFPNGLPTQVDPGGGTTFTFEVIPQQSTPEQGSALLHVDPDGTGANFTPYPVVELSENVFEATIPATPCGNTIGFYVSIDTTDGETVSSPFNAPDGFYSAFSISGIAIHLEDDFQSDTGWTVENIDLQAGAWERGVPVGGGTRGDPAVDFDGSGACMLTQNQAGDSDVDGGPTRLISPVFDLSAFDDPIISYARWFTNDDNDADAMVVEISNNSGATWSLVETVSNSGGWVVQEIHVLDYFPPNNQIRMRFSVMDNPNDSVTEAGLDAFIVKEELCDVPVCANGGTLIEGAGESGDFNATCGSDDSYWSAHGEVFAFQIADPVTQFELNALAPVGFAGSTISVDIEARKENANANLNLRVSLFDFANGSFVSLPGVMPLATTDATQNFELPAGSDPTDFIDVGTNEVRLLIQTIQTSGLANVRTQMDEVQFNFE